MMRFHRLTQDSDPPFNMWNLIIKFMICIYMSESIQMIKLPLNNFFFLGGFKKDHISRNDELLVCLIV